MKPMDVPLLVVFDRESKKLECYVFGTQGSVDNGKRVLEEFQLKGGTLVAAFVATAYNSALTEQDISFVYLNRYDENKEVVRRENGRYVVGE
jgi:hypothetical protein